MSTTIYTWNPLTGNVIEESDGSGSVLCTYTNKPSHFGPLISENRSGTISYYHADAIGSTRLTTNSSQTLVDSFLFDAWGNTVAATESTTTPYQWCGRWGYQTEPTLHNVNCRARMYQPAVARWLSIDPLTTTLRLSIRHAFLQYCYNNDSPCRGADPSGMDPPQQQVLPFVLQNPNSVLNTSLYVWTLTYGTEPRRLVFNPLTTPDEVFAAMERYIAEWLAESRIVPDVPDDDSPNAPASRLPADAERPEPPIDLERPPPNSPDGIALRYTPLSGNIRISNPFTGDFIRFRGSPDIPWQAGFLFAAFQDPDRRSPHLDHHESWLIPWLSFGGGAPITPAQLDPNPFNDDRR